MPERTYTPTADVYEPLIDGSGEKCVARAGVPIPWTTAQALGLVAGDPPPPRRARSRRAPRTGDTDGQPELP